MSEEHRPVTVLYTMPKSVYLGMPGVDCWDEVRDARKWPGGTPVVAHPPCRLWSSLRFFSHAPIAEKMLGWHAVRMVDRFGGVLEQPAFSGLWRNQGLPCPGRAEPLNYTVVIRHVWFGGLVDKPTWFWVRGVPMNELPPIPFRLGEGTHVVTSSHGCKRRPALSRSARQSTPVEMAEWLVAVARLVPEGFNQS
jgi:hypothetical protein